MRRSPDQAVYILNQRFSVRTRFWRALWFRGFWTPRAALNVLLSSPCTGMVRVLPYTRAAVSSVRGTDWPNAGLVLMLSFLRQARLLPSVAPLLAYMYISTSHTSGTPNRQRTGPHLSPPQALMAETSRLVCALDLRRAKRASVYTSVP